MHTLSCQSKWPADVCIGHPDLDMCNHSEYLSRQASDAHETRDSGSQAACLFAIFIRCRAATLLRAGAAMDRVCGTAGHTQRCRYSEQADMTAAAK